MKVRVRLIGQFSQRFGFSEKELEVTDPGTAADVVSRIGMGGLPHIVTREGQALGPADRLQDGDRVVIAPIFSGG